MEQKVIAVGNENWFYYRLGNTIWKEVKCRNINGAWIGYQITWITDNELKEKMTNVTS